MSSQTILRPSTPIDTTRFRLRPLTMADFDDVHAYYCRADVARYLYWNACTPEETRAYLARNVARTAIENDDDGLVYAVVPHDTGRVVGQVTLRLASREHRQGEVGFILHPDHHGRGYATEAATVMLDLGFGELGLYHDGTRFLMELSMRWRRRWSTADRMKTASLIALPSVWPLVA